MPAGKFAGPRDREFSAQLLEPGTHSAFTGIAGRELVATVAAEPIDRPAHSVGGHSPLAIRQGSARVVPLAGASMRSGYWSAALRRKRPISARR